MRTRTIQAVAWILIAVLSIGIIVDWLLLFGCARIWQYIYNGLALCCVTGLLVLALGDKLKEDGRYD